jgi:tetratricopeptide (TPR) repeat protein
MRGALLTVICLIAAACSATGPGPRAVESGFAIEAGVADPYGDGKQYLAAGRYQLAVERFGQALARDRDSVDALNGLAIAYSRLGRFDVAQTYFERALQIDATNVSTLNNYGWSLSEQGRLREAKPFLELALRHAELADAPIVAGNIEGIRRARPSALVAALEGDREPAVHLGPDRLIRVDENAYRLETSAAELSEPAAAPHDAPSSGSSLRQGGATVVLPSERAAGADETSAPAAVTEGLGGRGDPAAKAANLRAAQPERDTPVNQPSGGDPIRLWFEPASEAKAATVKSGEKP